MMAETSMPGSFKIFPILRQNWPYYLTGTAVIIIIKVFYGHAAASRLTWILTPTAWWVRTLSRIPFEYDPIAGYVNYPLRFIIAPSCSGVQFVMIAIAMLIFSYVHRMDTKKKKIIWTLFSFGISYLSTVFINGFRILLSIYLPASLPVWLHNPRLYEGWLTRGRLHTMTGVAVYFTSLFILYHGAGHISGKPFPTWSPPLFWYVFLVLGLPFLNRACKNNGPRFLEYAALLAAVCTVILFLFFLAGRMRRHFMKRHGNTAVDKN